MSTTCSRSRFLDKVRSVAQVRRLAKSTESSYLHWIREFIRFHDNRHPAQMATPEVEAYLTHLAQVRRVSRSTQNQALSAILFLYRHVLLKPLSERIDSVRAPRRRRIPVVLHPEEVHRLLGRLSGTDLLIAQLLYGSGLRIDECLSLRIHQLDFCNQWITLRDAKGGKDRITIMPRSVVPSLANHIVRVRRIHTEDLAQGFGQAYLPDAFHIKNPSAIRSFEWQFVFPAPRLFYDRRTGNAGRWHVHADTFRRTFQRAARDCGFTKRVSPHTLRHSFATHMLATGCDVRLLQSLLGHSSLSTTMIYAHLADYRIRTVTSPLDAPLLANPEGGSARPNHSLEPTWPARMSKLARY